MAKLTAAKRANLSPKTFAGPDRSFPIPDKAHARAALQDLPKAKGLSTGQKATIRSRAQSKLGHTAKQRTGKTRTWTGK